VLAVGAIASAILGSGVDAVLVATVMGGNALISGFQRLRAEQALRRLFLQQEIVARRLCRSQRPAAELTTVASLDAVPMESVPARALHPGDVIALRAADVVPADARLLSATDLEVDESTLTGESMPAQKDVEPTPAAPLAERTCMVFEGTSVLAGTAYAVVVATGDATEAGRATRAAGRAAPPAGLQAQLAEVTRTALPATAIGGAAVTGLGVLRGLPLREAISAGVSVAVAAVPEGLPLVATVAQAAAARRLSRRGVLVRSSRTLEALGRVDVVCFDKTGTLTKGQLSVARLATSTNELDPDSEQARHLLRTAARACPAVDPEHVDSVPHATDRAILKAAADLVDDDPDDGDWRLLTEVPFESNRGYAASFGETDDGRLLVVKGAPEAVLPRCVKAGKRAGETVERLAADGLRVLAVASRSNGLPDEGDIPDDAVTDLTLVGFVGVADVPRSDAADALRRITKDGIRVVMVTGDHPATAAAIAREVGMPADSVLNGADLDGLSEAERIRRVAETSIFARVSPEQKLRIVEALQADGKVVAMTGDGTNDAAAIRLADIGIGVAASGSTAARTAADLVLAEADVRRIYEAVLEGRALWTRVRDAVSILVGGNAGEIGFMVLGTALSGRAPIGVRQMLLVNLLTDMFPALAVAVSPGRNGSAELGRNGPDELGRNGPDEPGRPADIGAALTRAVVVRGSATALAALLAWALGRFTGRRQRASSMGLAALVGTQLAQTLVTGRHSPMVVATTIASAAVLVAVVETPGVSHFFGCTPLGPVAWGVVIASSAAGTAAAALAPRLLPERRPPLERSAQSDTSLSASSAA
jgi:cation-transporting P-type ATPase I